MKAIEGGKTTYYPFPTFEVEGPDSLSLSVQNTSTGGNSYTYRTFNNTTTYTIQAGDVLSYDEYHDATNPSFEGGFDAVLSVSGTVRDYSGWVDQQHGIGIHPGYSVAPYAVGQWYTRTFDMSNKAGQVLSTFKIVCEGDASGFYVIRLRNIKVLHNGAVVAVIYSGGFAPADIQADGPTSGVHFQTLLRSTSYYPAGGQRVAMRRAGYGSSDGLFYLLHDQLGSTEFTVDSSGNNATEQRYTPWGKIYT